MRSRLTRPLPTTPSNTSNSIEIAKTKVLSWPPTVISLRAELDKPKLKCCWAAKAGPMKTRPFQRLDLPPVQRWFIQYYTAFCWHQSKGMKSCSSKCQQTEVYMYNQADQHSVEPRNKFQLSSRITSQTIPLFKRSRSIGYRIYGMWRQWKIALWAICQWLWHWNL